MRLSPYAAALASLLWLPTAGTAQQLHVSSTKIIADLPHLFVLPLRCDSGQNVFVWGADPSGGRLPILELNADGKELLRFNISEATQDGIERAFVQTYAVTSDGSLYELLALPSGIVAGVHFRPTGEYAGAVYLDKRFNTVHLAVFRTGELLVDGTTAMGSDSHEPFLTIFDPMGRLLAEVQSGEPPLTLSAPAPPKRGEKAHTQGAEISPGSVAAFDLSMAESGSDLVYVLRQGKKPAVLAISPSGLIDHKLVLAPPAGDPQVVALKAGPSQLLVEYVQPQAAPNGSAVSTFVVYDSNDGTNLAEYEPDPGLGSFACTDWRGGFTFLSRNDNDQPILLSATAR